MIVKQLLVLSGKGGTGKTTIAGAFIRLAGAKVVADCDVDAPNLHLLMDNLPPPKNKDYYGLDKAWIDASRCSACDVCRQYCRFDAIYAGSSYTVDPYRCEGCGVCGLVCPVQAIRFVPTVSGQLTLFKNDMLFSTARLRMGSGNSGLLVTEVKRGLEEAEIGQGVAIIDGSPGIGCPVHASLSGVDLVLLVAEPSLSGLLDLERIMQTASQLQVEQVVCINKYDVNEGLSRKMEELCRERNVCLVGKIPFDPWAVEAANRGLSIVDVPGSAGLSVREVYRNTLGVLLR